MMLEMLYTNMLSPAVLLFVLGLVAALAKSDLAFPKGLSDTLSIYLLLAIGFKGGIGLSAYPVSELVRPMWAGLMLGMIIPLLVIGYFRLRGLDKYNTVALAATYGSVSIVTYGAGVDFVEGLGLSFEGYMNAIVALMEVPAILVSLIMLKAWKSAGAARKPSTAATLQSRWLPLPQLPWASVHEALLSKSVLLLIGGLAIGWICGEEALPVVGPLFIDMYRGFLLLFLLGMGLVCGAKLKELRREQLSLLPFALLAPVLFGSLGVWVGSIIDLSIGGAVLLGVLAGSASYIAAPAALRASVPEASPSIYLTLALGITFPFNLSVGIPLFYAVAQLLYG
ncbi:sodium-dependent bicarbonate transport family permease [Paenibacillus sp. 1P07SE]|uniref:sodium-dependent bicarbonate transport family permease n=1 Tax=Paenibacillus sp. 1P07SE TaxID=3132209 RepID=UPI0039A50857